MQCIHRVERLSKASDKDASKNYGGYHGNA